MAVPAATTGDSVTDDDRDGVEGDGNEKTDTTADYDDFVATEQTQSLRWPALVAALVVFALAGLCTYLGVHAYRSHQAAEQRNLFLSVARQGAVNLTTIDWQTADADVQRIVDSATGPFYDDFSQRSQPFLQVVKQMQSKSVGTVTEAAIESESGDEAQALVSVSVTTTSPGAAEQSPRNWRMRISVQRSGDSTKVSNVEFVP